MPPATGHGRQRSPWARGRVVGVVLLALVLLVGGVVVVALRAAEPSPDGAGDPAAGASPFVQRSGTRLLADGRPFRFTGFNSYVMTDCGFPEQKLDDAARDTFFASLRPDSVVRFFATPDADLAKVDAVVQTARRHAQRLVVVLSDGQGECGDTEKDEGFYRDGFRGEYLSWVRTLVPRYAEDPTIAMWELMNEPHDVPVPVLRAFYDEAGGLVHQLAPRHLVSSGTLQPDTYGGMEQYREVSASPGVDVLSLHEYDAVPAASYHAGPALEAARSLDKPLLVGEWGLTAHPAGAQPTPAPVGGGPCFSLEGRRDVAEAKLTAYLQDPDIAGALVWSYMARLEPSCTLTTAAGDPLVELIHDIDIPHRDCDTGLPGGCSTPRAAALPDRGGASTRAAGGTPTSPW